MSKQLNFEYKPNNLANGILTDDEKNLLAHLISQYSKLKNKKERIYQCKKKKQVFF